MSALRPCLLVVLVYAALLADTVAAPYLAIGGVSPDWSALVVIAWMLHARAPYTVLVSGLAGLLVDLAAAERVGPGVVAFALTGYLLSRLAPLLRMRSLVVETAVAGGATFAIGGILTATALLTGRLDVGLGHCAVHLVGVAAYTSLVAVPLLMIQGWFAGDSARIRWRRMA